MDVPPPSLPWDSTLAEELRVRYRCGGCRKSCSVPCRFTFAEFQAMERVIREEASR